MGKILKKAIYKPTNQNTIIINQLEGYCEILLDNEYKTVSVNDLILLVPKLNLGTSKDKISLDYEEKKLMILIAT